MLIQTTAAALDAVEKAVSEMDKLNNNKAFPVQPWCPLHGAYILGTHQLTN